MGCDGRGPYLIDLKVGHMNYAQAKRALRAGEEMRKLFPYAAHHVLIENAPGTASNSSTNSNAS